MVGHEEAKTGSSRMHKPINFRTYRCLYLIIMRKPSNYLAAIANQYGVENDLILLCKWVREELFYVLMHDLKGERDDTMKEEGPLCNAFVKCFSQIEKRVLLLNTEIKGASDDAVISYLKYLWSKGLHSKEKSSNIRKQLSLEKTAVYAALNDAFKSKYCHA